MAVTVDTSGLDRLMESWDALVRQFPEKAGPPGAGRHQTAPGGADGHRQHRQGVGLAGPHMGSGGGYVAVRPKAETYQTTKSGKRYAVGYITNAIESGHRHGGPRGGERGTATGPAIRRRRCPAAFSTRPRGRPWPVWARREADRLMQLIVDGLEGKL